MKRGNFSCLSAEKGSSKRNKVAANVGKVRVGSRPPLSPVKPAQQQRGAREEPAHNQVKQRVHAIPTPDGKIAIVHDDSSCENTVIALPAQTKEIVLKGSSGEDTVYILPQGTSEILLFLKISGQENLDEGLVDARSVSALNDSASKSKHKDATESEKEEVIELAPHIESTEGRAKTDAKKADKESSVAADAISGANTLRRVVRATGVAPGKELRSLFQAGGRSGEVARYLAGDSVVAGVKFSEILKQLKTWVAPSIRDEKFYQWLHIEAPAFPSLIAPENLEMMFDGTPVGDLREFVATNTTAADAKYNSPLTTDESNFIRLRYNAVPVAAHALGSSDEELHVELDIAKSKNSRQYSLRATYLWLIRIKDEPCILIYIGESLDVESRISCHLESLFDKHDDSHMQNGHRVARNHLPTEKGEVDIRLFVISAYDEESARRLAQSYVRFCGRENQPTILEVARACAAVGFFSEAVYTAVFDSLHERSRVGRVGLNFSQPGTLYGPLQSKLSLQERIDLGLTAYRGNLTPNACSLIFCDVCETWTYTVKYVTGQKRTDGSDGLQCKLCYESLAQAIRYANTDTFKCEECGKDKTGFQRPFTRPDGRDGVRCKACENKEARCKREDWDCATCRRTMEGKAERRKHPLGGYQCAMCAKRAKQAIDESTWRVT